MKTHRIGKLERKIKLVESIASLDDRELKFIVMRKLKGFRSKEIASELVYKRNKKGEVRFDEKGEKLKADAAYVDSRFSEAKIQFHFFYYPRIAQIPQKDKRQCPANPIGRTLTSPWQYSAIMEAVLCQRRGSNPKSSPQETSITH